MSKLESKLKLYGFNNLTKTLSFNIYDICYAKTEREQKDYIAYIDEHYNSERLTKILLKVTDMIGAQVLNISKQDYEPQGASVNVLIAEERIDLNFVDSSCNKGNLFLVVIWILKAKLHTNIELYTLTLIRVMLLFIRFLSIIQTTQSLLFV